MVDPRCAHERTDIPVSKIVPRPGSACTDKPDPTLRKSLKDKALPMETKSRTEDLAPKREGRRMEREEP
jgi:hypothetical protein